MRFVDSNVLIYAILDPKRRLTEREKGIKESAERLMQRINNGEEVVTSVVHISEIANILEDAANLGFAVSFTRDLISRWNITVEPVDRAMYILAIAIADEKKIGINDALAYEIMKKKEIKEIYSFDKHFDNLPVNRLVK